MLTLGDGVGTRFDIGLPNGQSELQSAYHHAGIVRFEDAGSLALSPLNVVARSSTLPRTYVQLSSVLEHPDHLCNSCTTPQRGGKQNFFLLPFGQPGISEAPSLQPILAASTILCRLVSQNASLL